MKANAELWLTMLLMMMAVIGARKGKKDRKTGPQWKASSMPDKEIRSESVYEGNDVRLDCRAQAHPKPSIKWLKNGDDLVVSDNIEIRKFELLLKNVTPDINGNYTCVVSNRHGQIEWTYSIIVAAKIWPLVANGPKNTTGVMGSSVTFQCQAANDPTATIRWQRMTRKENRDDSSPLAEFLPDPDDPQYLVLNDITKDDEREYRCMVGNIYGLIYSSAWLRVIAPDTPQEIPRSLEVDVNRMNSNNAVRSEFSRERDRNDADKDKDNISPFDWVNTSDDVDSSDLDRETSDNIHGLDLSENDLDTFITTTKPPKIGGNKGRKNGMKMGKKGKNKNRLDEVAETSSHSVTTTELWPTTTIKTWPESTMKMWPANPARTWSTATMNIWPTSTMKTWSTSAMKTWPTIATEKISRSTPIEIWNFETNVENDEFSDSRNTVLKSEETENEDNSKAADNEQIKGSISSWTIYTIVGAIGGVILLIGLLAITLTLCCKRDEDGNYKSTSV